MYVPEEHAVTALLVREMTGSGVRVIAPWQHDDPHYQRLLADGNDEMFMGFPGTREGDVFSFSVTTPNNHPSWFRIPRNTASFVFMVHIVPVGVTDSGDIRDQPYERSYRDPMLQVAFPDTRSPAFIDDMDAGITYFLEPLVRNHIVPAITTGRARLQHM
jgi:hypothetical protein